MKVISLFAGAGGFDLGFVEAGFKVVWANEFDKTVWPTFKANFPKVPLDTRSIVDIKPEDIPESDGFLGGPPCQSWSIAGAGKGIKDERGNLFYEYIRLLKAKQPKFFLIENVAGMLHKKHEKAFKDILKALTAAGYKVSHKLLDARDYSVPQDRKRVIIGGIRKDLKKDFWFPSISLFASNLEMALKGLKKAVPAKRNKANKREDLSVANHEYMTGGFSSMYMSRNRVREWHQASYTIQASGRHAPIHPKAPVMLSIGKDKMAFVPGKERLYRRLSVRECARIQTFPDSFEFLYDNIADGYKMVGNAVPACFAFHLAIAVKVSFELK